MLAQKQQTLPYISIFKTHSGEEFIAKVVEETMLAYTVRHPLCMVQTEKGMQFAPYLMMVDHEKTISIPKPMITGTPAKQLESQYEQAISPIALPTV